MKDVRAPRRPRPFVTVALLMALLMTAPAGHAFDRPDVSRQLRGPGELATGQQLGPSHSGEARTSLKPPLRKKWQVRLGDLMGDSEVSYPVVADGRVFAVVDHTHQEGPDIVALDARTGRTLWRRNIGRRGFRAGLTYTHGKVIVLPPGGLLRAYDARSGRIIWTINLNRWHRWPGDGSFGSPPVASRGRIYVWDGWAAWSLDHRNGAVIWVRWLGLASGAQSAPVLTEKAVIFSYDSHIVDGPDGTVAHDRRTGRFLWRRDHIDQEHRERLYRVHLLTEGAPAVYGGRVYTRTDLSFEVLDASTGALLGFHTSERPPAFSGHLGFFAYSASYRQRVQPPYSYSLDVHVEHNAVEAYDLSTGSILWTFRGDRGIWSSPIVAGDYVFVAGHRRVYAGHKLTGVALRHGDLPWWFIPLDERNGEDPHIGLAAADSTLYVPAGPYLIAYSG